MECLDQTACAGVVLSGSALFSQTCLRPVGDRAYGSISSVLVCHLGVVGWCEGAVYLTSLGRPTDIGLQLGKACYPCSG